MTITAVGTQEAGKTTDTASSVFLAFASNVVAGNLVIVGCLRYTGTTDDIAVVGDLVFSGTAVMGTQTLDKVQKQNTGAGLFQQAMMFSAVVTTGGTLTCTVNGNASDYWAIGIGEYNSTVGWGSTRTEATNGAVDPADDQTTAQAGNVTSANDALFAGAMNIESSGLTAITEPTNFTLIYEEEDGVSHVTGNICRRIVAGGSTQTGTWTLGTPNAGWEAVLVAYKELSVGVTNVTPRKFYNAQTGIVVAGVLFGAAQGSGKVWISPTDNVSDGSRVEQTVTAWADTSVTITSVRGALSMATTLYLFVVENGGTSNTPGYPVEFITSASLAWTKG